METKFKFNFKKFGGEAISDLGAYIREYLKKFPGTTIYIGTDSVERGKHILYVTVVAFYDEFRRDGVHYIFSKEYAQNNRMWVEKTGDRAKDKVLLKAAKESNVYNKIWGEVERALALGDFLETELEGLVKRKGMNELIEYGFSPHQNKLVALDIDINMNPGFKIPEDLKSTVTIKNREYNIDEKNDRLVNIDNPRQMISFSDLSEEDLQYVIDVHTTQPARLKNFLSQLSSRDVKNKSQLVYEAARSTLEGQGYRVRFKPNAWAATCAADFVCDKYRRENISRKKSAKKAA